MLNKTSSLNGLKKKCDTLAKEHDEIEKMIEKKAVMLSEIEGDSDVEDGNPSKVWQIVTWGASRPRNRKTAHSWDRLRIEQLKQSRVIEAKAELDTSANVDLDRAQVFESMVIILNYLQDYVIIDSNEQQRSLTNNITSQLSNNINQQQSPFNTNVMLYRKYRKMCELVQQMKMLMFTLFSSVVPDWAIWNPLVLPESVRDIWFAQLDGYKDVLSLQ